MIATWSNHEHLGTMRPQNVNKIVCTCLWRWFLLVCLLAGPVAYAGLASLVYCRIYVMPSNGCIMTEMSKSFAGISSWNCSNGWVYIESNTCCDLWCQLLWFTLKSCWESIRSIAGGGSMYSLWVFWHKHNGRLLRQGQGRRCPLFKWDCAEFDEYPIIGEAESLSYNAMSAC
jgi:hypothetical protein